MNNELREALIKLIREQVPNFTVPAEVIAVNADNSCDVKLIDDPDVVLYDVRLRSVIDQESIGIIPVPVFGSTVLVSVISNNPQSNYISSFSAIERYIITNSKGISIELESVLNLNGNQFGGLAKVQELASRIAALETAMDTHVHPGVTTGSGSTLVITPMFPSKTTRSDIENTNVNHG